jgi:hypothetical protein
MRVGPDHEKCSERNEDQFDPWQPYKPDAEVKTEPRYGQEQSPPTIGCEKPHRL